MQDEVAEFMELPNYCTAKVHRLICLELKKLIGRISQIFLAMESARPGATSGIQTLCSLHTAMEKANSLIRHCSECSKLYLAITGDKIVLRCENIRNALESCLTQIQNMVPPLLVAKISRILDDLRTVSFTVESSEDEAGRAIRALLLQDITASYPVNVIELKALRLAALRLNITSQIALLIEKRSIRMQLGKINDRDSKKKKILNYLLYLLRKYGKSGAHRTESTISQHEKSLNQSMAPEPLVEKGGENGHADVFDTAEPPEEFICPLSKRLMHDPVIIDSGQTFERVWIENWLNEGRKTCPKTNRKLVNLSLTPNSAIKDMILGWCMKQDVTIPNPCSLPTSAPHHLQKYSSSLSIASIGSSLNELQLQTSNVSIRSSDTYCGVDSSVSNNNSALSWDPSHMNADSHRVQTSTSGNGIDFASFSKLAALPWASQCKAVEDVRKELEDSKQPSHSLFPGSYIKPLFKFLNDAHNTSDSKAQRDAVQLLLTFVSERFEVPLLHEDAIYVLSQFLDSDIAKEALAIMEVLSRKQYYKSAIGTSGVLPSILVVLENQDRELNQLALKILLNLSSDSNIGHHMVYLDSIPKLVPFLSDRALAVNCIKIFRNLCDNEEARNAVAESNACTDSIAELLEIGNSEEQELAMDVLLSLCHQCPDYCQLVTKESIVQSLLYLSVNGNARVMKLATDLVQLSGGFIDSHGQECSIPNNGLNLDISRDSVHRPKRKESSITSGIRGRKKSFFSKSRQ